MTTITKTEINYAFSRLQEQDDLPEHVNEFIRDAALAKLQAGELKDSPYQGSAGTWVKASERLPEFVNKDKKYIVRYIKIPDELEVWNWDWINERHAAQYDFEWLDSAATPAGHGWQDKYLSEMTDIMRDADKLFEQGGGGTRHYMRGLFEIMEEKGFAIVRLPTPPNKSV